MNPGLFMIELMRKIPLSPRSVQIFFHWFLTREPENTNPNFLLNFIVFVSVQHEVFPGEERTSKLHQMTTKNQILIHFI